MYLLDANVFVEAKNHYYRMSTFPGVWSWMESSLESGQVSSIRMVYDELSSYGDELTDWVKEQREYFVPADDEDTQTVFADIAQFVMDHQVYKETEKNRFLAKADPFLIAKAKTSGAIVITHEVLVPDNSTKVKIPNICDEFGVEYRNTFDLLETLEAQFTSLY